MFEANIKRTMGATYKICFPAFRAIRINFIFSKQNRFFSIDENINPIIIIIIQLVIVFMNSNYVYNFCFLHFINKFVKIVIN